MGAWGAGCFDNDDALDWLAEFSDSDNGSIVREALAIVAERSADELDASAESEALAAAEVVAAALGRPAPKLPEEVYQWLEKHDQGELKELVPLARAAVSSIQAHSELRDLWAESSLENWLEAVQELETRLG